MRDQFEPFLGERFGQFARVGDSGRTANELRRRAIERANALQAPDQVGEMAPVNPPIVVQLIDHKVAQVLKNFGPAGVMRKDAAVQHVRVGQHHVGAFPYGFAGVLWRVPVVGEGPDWRAHRIHGALQLVQLVFGQRLGGEQVHGAGPGVFHHPVQHRQVVTEGLPAGGGRHNHHVLARPDQPEGFRLMAVKLRDALLEQRLPEPVLNALREGCVLARAGRQMMDRANWGVVVRSPGLETGQRRLQAGGSRQPGFRAELRKTERQVCTHRVRLFFAPVYAIFRGRDRRN